MSLFIVSRMVTRVFKRKDGITLFSLFQSLEKEREKGFLFLQFLKDQIFFLFWLKVKKEKNTKKKQLF